MPAPDPAQFARTLTAGLSLLASFWLAPSVLRGQEQEPATLRLRIPPRDGHEWIQLTGAFDQSVSRQRVSILTSSNLAEWSGTAVLHSAGSFGYIDPASSASSQRFYKAEVSALTPEDDWKNQVVYPNDPYQEAGAGGLNWIKFVIPLSDPTRVYYAAPVYRFHYDFVAARLDPFRGISPTEFNRISLFNGDRQLILGSILVPRREPGEYGIQFVGQDVIDAEQVRTLLRLVESTVVPNSDQPLQPVYVPTFEQAVMTQTNADFFLNNGILTGTADRWAGADISYSEGWALGVLKYVPAVDVATAYATGVLCPEDILIIDAVPAELPHVAGIITLTPSTPSSHVAILARSYQVPFGYFVRETDRQRVLQLTNRVVAFQSCPSLAVSCNMTVAAVDDSITSEDRAQLEGLRAAPALNLTPVSRHGSYAVPADGLLPASVTHVGGKAANFGLLRRVIPDYSPAAIALTFDLWQDFMAQSLTAGVTLGQEISNRLAGLTYPRDIAAIQTQLNGIRNLIRNATSFTPAQEAAILNALSIFDPQRNIRFRSSTNVEDAQSFTGAGLYDSFSGCLLDDLDGDREGPSQCDQTETDERGVFRAIRRVYASFYNDNAYLERQRLNVIESEVGMAVLVHHSTPDDIERANGVATATWIRKNDSLSGHMTSQPGAVSVANPDSSIVPEEISFWRRADGTAVVTQLRNSSLLRLGETAMAWEQDYLDLAGLLYRVGQEYAALFPGKEQILLNFEYKKIDPGQLQVKQIREIPNPEEGDSPAFVLDIPAAYFSWHGFYGDPWMAHRIKSRWSIRHRNTLFTRSNLLESFYTDITIEHLEGPRIRTLGGPPSTFPNAGRELVPYATFDPERVLTRDHWTMNTLAGPADITLQLHYENRGTHLRPFSAISLVDYDIYRLEVAFHEPVLTITLEGDVVYRTNATSRLYLMPPEPEQTQWRSWDRTFSCPGTNVSIHVDYLLPDDAAGDDCRCPIIRIEESRVEGLTIEPIVLRGFWSQTYSDIHAPSSVEFLFEPRLEENMAATLLAELDASDIVQIYANDRGRLFVVGNDGSPRRLSSVP